MFRSVQLTAAVLTVALIALGCQTQTPPATTSAANTALSDSDGQRQRKDDATETKVTASLAKLSLEDRQLAEAQQFCAVRSRQRLGSMGAPLKLEIKGEPVFVCCAGCKSKALKNPDETLTRVAALKSANKTTHP